MTTVVPFPLNRVRVAFTQEDRAALDRLVGRLRRAGAHAVEVEGGQGAAQAFVTGVEGETLMIVRKSPTGVSVHSGFADQTLWHGRNLHAYA